MPKRYFTNTIKDDATSPDENWKHITTQTISQIVSEISPLQPKGCDGGLYVGYGGIAYAFWYAASKPIFAEHRMKFLENARVMIDYQLQVDESTAHRKRHVDMSGFLLGDCGAFAAGALIYRSLGNIQASDNLLAKYASLVNALKPVDVLKTGGDELFVGRAGYLCGILNLQTKLGAQVVPESDIFDLCKSIVESGRRYSMAHKSPSPLMYAYHEVEYLGAAHGLSAILQILLSFPNYLASDPSAESDVRRSLDFLMSIQTSEGNFPCATDEIGSGNRRPPEDDLVHWCHGAPGTIYALARAYHFWPSEQQKQRYLNAAIQCGEVIWKKGLLRKGPGICHGIAGSAYAFLLLYQLTNDEKYYHRAVHFGRFTLSEEFKSEARRPDSPSSLYEGLAGTCCFYAELTGGPAECKTTAEFPLFPVVF